MPTSHLVPLAQQDPVTAVLGGKPRHVRVLRVIDGTFTGADLTRGNCYLYALNSEGVTWIRGWISADSPEVRALLTANALVRDG